MELGHAKPIFDCWLCQSVVSSNAKHCNFLFLFLIIIYNTLYGSTFPYCIRLHLIELFCILHRKSISINKPNAHQWKLKIMIKWCTDVYLVMLIFDVVNHCTVCDSSGIDGSGKWEDKGKRKKKAETKMKTQN